MKLKIYTDGGSLNNPGQAAVAYVIYKDGLVIKKYNNKIGVASNNVAEYSALVSALEYVLETFSPIIKSVFEISVYSDSELMVKQLDRKYKIKKPELLSLAEKVRNLEKKIGIKIKYTHVLRDKNQLADSLVKKALLVK